jgi:hypothetical protein
MAALNIDFSVEQGSTFVLDFQVFDDLLSPVELLSSAINQSGSVEYSFNQYRLKTRLKRSRYTTPILLGMGTTMNYITQPGDTAGFYTDGFFMIGGQTGQVRMVMSSDTTAAFKAGRYLYDVELIETVGNGTVVSKLLTGKFDIDAEATK